MVEIRRYFHENAEVSFALDKTVALVVKKLTEYGYKPEVIGDHNVVVTVGSGGKTILLRADMDALPIIEDTGLPFASTNGNMHACGHDIHTTMLLGAAKLLKKHESELKGTVKLYFQPAEETVLGCKNGIEAGVMENPHVDAAFAIHTGGGERGKDDISMKKTVSNASCDNYKIILKGKSAHGSGPHAGINAVTAASHIVVNLHNIVAAEMPSTGIVSLATCKLIGGTAQNIIPDKAELQGTMRTLDNKLRDQMKRRVEEIVGLTAKLFMVEYEFEWMASVPILINDEKLREDLTRYIKNLGLDVKVTDDPGMGSEDFALIHELVPSVYMHLACFWHFECGPGRGGHTPFIIYDEDRMYAGTAVYAACAAEWLNENQ